MKTLDMRFIRYINLFEKVTGIRTQNCFSYNNCIFFAVDKNNISRAIGAGGRNIREISETIKRKVKIVAVPRGIIDAREFISQIVEPVTFKNIDIVGNEIIINAGKQSKAALIGREKIRLKEMNDIVNQYFGKQVRIN